MITIVIGFVGIFGVMLLSLLGVGSIVALILYNKRKDAKIHSLVVENEELLAALDKVRFQKKSSEVRLGKIAEQLVPFMEDWPYDSSNFRFVGNPIDGIQFNDDQIIFLEIKTGNARLSKRQTEIKKLISEGKVSFVSLRVSDRGVIMK